MEVTKKLVKEEERSAELYVSVHGGCFLVMLHTMENLLIVFLSRLVYLQEIYPLGIVVFDSVSVFSNLLGVAMSVFYVFKKELYADLPHDIPGSPSFRPEVGCEF